MRAEALLEVLVVLRQREDGHDLARGGDVEAVFARRAVRFAAEADDDVAQEAIVHVERAAPGDLARVDADRSGVRASAVAEVDGVVEQRAEQVVRGGDGVDVAGEVEVDVVGRDERRLAAAGAAALDAEDRAERRLAQARTAFLPRRRRPIARPIDVVVFPSPAGVGLIAVTRIEPPLARAADDRSRRARSWPCPARRARCPRLGARAPGRRPGSCAVRTWTCGKRNPSTSSMDAVTRSALRTGPAPPASRRIIASVCSA